MLDTWYIHVTKVFLTVCSDFRLSFKRKRITETSKLFNNKMFLH
jgi:hypothetical protein